MKKIIFLLIAIAFYSCDTEKKSTDKKETETKDAVVLSSQLQPTFSKDDPTQRTQANFDDYAWQMFVALNWPASTTERGVADTSKKIGDPGTVVWQTYRTSESVFLEDAKDPGDWNSGYTSTIELSNTSKVDSDIEDKLSATSQAVGGPLVDQNLNYVYFEKLMNKVEYDYIKSNTYYDLSVLQKLNKNLNMPNGSIEIKSAWKIMGDNDDKTKFFTGKAKISNPNSTYNNKVVTVGLVGLHIIHKSEQSPQWVWATFEHIGNDPNEKDATTATGHFSFFNADCKDCELNEKQGSSSKPKFATQVARFTPIREDAKNANTTWQGLLKNTIWENYELVSTQWPTQPNNPQDRTGWPTPNIVANTTMETYNQDTSSCIGCHSTATPVGSNYRSDFSFLFLEAQNPSN